MHSFWSKWDNSKCRLLFDIISEFFESLFRNPYKFLIRILSQLTFTCSMSAIETLEKGMK